MVSTAFGGPILLFWRYVCSLYMVSVLWESNTDNDTKFYSSKGLLSKGILEFLGRGCAD